MLFKLSGESTRGRQKTTNKQNKTEIARGLGIRGLGIRGLGIRGLGIRGLGIRTRE